MPNIILQLELTKITEQPIAQHPIVVLPIIYDIGNQLTTLVERRDLNTPPFIMHSVAIQLRKFLDKRGVATSESSLYAAIHDLLSNLTLQTGQPQQMPGAPPFMQGQVGPMGGMQNQQMPLQQMVSGPPMALDHPQQIMNPQVMGQVMGGGQQMNPGYGQMGQMGGPSNE